MQLQTFGILSCEMKINKQYRWTRTCLYWLLPSQVSMMNSVEKMLASLAP